MNDPVTANQPTLTVNQTPDVVIKSFTTDPTNGDFEVNYVIAANSSALNPVQPFSIGIYRSADGTTDDQLMTSVPVNGSNLIPGYRTVEFAPDANFDAIATSSDYYLRAVLDNTDQVPEADKSNNEMVYQGGAFITPAGVLHIQGADGTDNVAIRYAGDANFDGVVNSQDTEAVASHSGPWEGDLNNDGRVDSNDTDLVTANSPNPQTIQVLENGVLYSFPLSSVTSIAVRTQNSPDNVFVTPNMPT
jgi:hypothetical protein